MHIRVPFFASISVCQGIRGVTDGERGGLTLLSLGQPFFPDSRLYESEFEFSCLTDVT